VKVVRSHFDFRTGVPEKSSHATCCTALTNSPSRGRRGRFVIVMQQLACKVVQRTAVGLTRLLPNSVDSSYGRRTGVDAGVAAVARRLPGGRWPPTSARVRGLRSKKIDIEVFRSLDPTEAGYATTSIKLRRRGLCIAHDGSQAEGLAASIACVVPHEIRSLVLTAVYDNSQQKKKQRVPCDLSYRSIFLCRPVYFQCSLRQLRQKTLLNRSLGIGAPPSAPVGPPHTPLTAVLQPPHAAVLPSSLTAVPAPSVTAAVACRGVSVTCATGPFANLTLLREPLLSPAARFFRGAFHRLRCSYGGRHAC